MNKKVTTQQSSSPIQKEQGIRQKVEFISSYFVLKHRVYNLQELERKQEEEL